MASVSAFFAGESTIRFQPPEPVVLTGDDTTLILKAKDVSVE
jgi:hypothetical protein